MSNYTTELLQIVTVRTTSSNQVLFTWKAPLQAADQFADISDEWWSATAGTFQADLSVTSKACNVIVNFSQVEWIDPIALLGLFVALKNFCTRTRSTLTVNLGTTLSQYSRRSGFIGFIAQHGFLNALGGQPNIQIQIDEELFPSHQGSPVWAKLAAEDLLLTYPESRCLMARIISATDLENDADKTISVELKKWLNEFRDYGLNAYFEGEAEIVDDVLHKVRVLLTEILHNAIEHAYLDQERSSKKHFGIYARVRRHAEPGSSKDTLGQLTKAITRENNCCPTLKQFSRGIHEAWIEIFYVDEGRGILADLDTWCTQADDILRAKLTKLKPQSNTLHQISRHLFQDQISRHKRENRTFLTGFQHVRLVLSEGEDFARVYSGGEWVGATHPWSKQTLGDPVNIGKLNKYKAYLSASGTAWHYCLRLDRAKHFTNDHRFADWGQITPDDSDKPDAEALQENGSSYDDWKVFDERDLGSGIDYCDWHIESLNHTRCLWLPGAITKQHVYQWISALLKQRVDSGTNMAIWLIADLSREQAHTLAAVLHSERSRRHVRIRIDVYLVTSDWHFLYLKAPGDQALFQKATSEDQIKKIAKISGRIVHLLREHDSKLFWQGLNPETYTPVGPALIHEQVIWKRGAKDKPIIVLNGYLDLTHALTSPIRVSVASRALRRIWYLYARDAECVAADVLLTNLLPREARLNLYDQRAGVVKTKPQVIVSSILVTGGTANRAIQVGRSAIHLLRHTQFHCGEDLISDTVKLSNRFALNWIHEPILATPCRSGKLPYERIPGTPYIGRGGAKAIPVRRFTRDDDNGQYFQTPIYEESPQETYDHFLALGLLKLGHWVYGAHHDLLTTNLGLAIDRESLDHGRLLKWLCAVLGNLKSSGAQLVVYPSHHVTEKMVQAIKRSAANGLCRDLPGHFLPVHFLGTHTQTAIRIPSLTYDRIREFLENSSGNDRVILLDDGTVTGKVHRELEQLIRNAGATEVIHVGLVSRTGLPLYRKYLLREHQATHRYYWRWDVPPLGNARTCPLCRALEQARELVTTLWSSDAKAAMEGWIEDWEEQPVSTHWWRHGVEPALLPAPRQITFGKEWPKDNTGPIEYPMHHSTTTGLAATVTELIRITSYKGVGTKIAAEPWNSSEQPPKVSSDWRRCRLEILICQTLLFFDDFDEQELDDRFEMTFTELLVPNHIVSDHRLDRLACLMLLLTSNRSAKSIIAKSAKALTKAPILQLEVLIIIGILARRAKLSLNDIKEKIISTAGLTPTEQIIVEFNLFAAFAHAHGETKRGTKHGLMMAIILLGETDLSAHTGFLRKKMVRELPATPSDVSKDLRLISQAFSEIDPLVLEGPLGNTLDLNQTANLFSKLAYDIESAIPINESTAWKTVGLAHKSIFGSTHSIANDFRRNFVKTIYEIQNHLTTGISSDEWDREVRRKTSLGEETRWIKDEFLITPTFRCELEDSISKDAAVVFPPIAQQLVRDFQLNVFHAESAYGIGQASYDMLCIISLQHDTFVLSLRNRAQLDSKLSGRKASESIVSSQIQGNPVDRYLDTLTHEMIVVIRLPLVTGLKME